ncbi:hypothetical protein [Burkholderia guangdongensis]|uniref:hypothetical protein n=1 Tax=Burkholderia guangdongensis TaxID=1792500 RepID=UPI0015CAA485|nr:hypothetical protein [Burkholderia guangdongensis]
MRLTNRKLSMLVAGTLAAIAVARYASADAIPTFYAQGTVQCRSIDANGQPSGCVPIDPVHFGFAALRSM